MECGRSALQVKGKRLYTGVRALPKKGPSDYKPREVQTHSKYDTSKTPWSQYNSKDHVCPKTTWPAKEARTLVDVYPQT